MEGGFCFWTPRCVFFYLWRTSEPSAFAYLDRSITQTSLKWDSNDTQMILKRDSNEIQTRFKGESNENQTRLKRDSNENQTRIKRDSKVSYTLLNKRSNAINLRKFLFLSSWSMWIMLGLKVHPCYYDFDSPMISILLLLNRTKGKMLSSLNFQPTFPLFYQSHAGERRS